MFGRDRKTIQIRVFGKTDLGRTRDHNEDRFLVADLTRQDASLLPRVREHDVGERGSLLVVADGMGGAAAGELASEMATTGWISSTQGRIVRRFMGFGRSALQRSGGVRAESRR